MNHKKSLVAVGSLLLGGLSYNAYAKPVMNKDVPVEQVKGNPNQVELSIGASSTDNKPITVEVYPLGQNQPLLGTSTQAPYKIIVDSSAVIQGADIKVYETNKPNEAITRSVPGLQQSGAVSSTTAQGSTEEKTKINSFADYLDALSNEKKGDFKIGSYFIRVSDYNGDGKVAITPIEATTKLLAFSVDPTKWNFVVEETIVNSQQKTQSKYVVRDNKVLKVVDDNVTDQELKFEVGKRYKIFANTGLEATRLPDGHVEIPLSIKCVKESGLEEMLLSSSSYIDPSQTVPDLKYRAGVYFLTNQGLAPGGEIFNLVEVKPFVYQGEDPTGRKLEGLQRRGIKVIKSDIRRLRLSKEATEELEERVKDWYANRNKGKASGEVILSSFLPTTVNSDQVIPLTGGRTFTVEKEDELTLPLNAEGRVNVGLGLGKSSVALEGEYTKSGRKVLDYTGAKNGEEVQRETRTDLVGDILLMYEVGPVRFGAGHSRESIAHKVTPAGGNPYTASTKLSGLVGKAELDAQGYGIPLVAFVKYRSASGDKTTDGKSHRDEVEGSYLVVDVRTHGATKALIGMLSGGDSDKVAKPELTQTPTGSTVPLTQTTTGSAQPQDTTNNKPQSDRRSLLSSVWSGIKKGLSKLDYRVVHESGSLTQPNALNENKQLSALELGLILGVARELDVELTLRNQEDYRSKGSTLGVRTSYRF